MVNLKYLSVDLYLLLLVLRFRSDRSGVLDFVISVASLLEGKTGILLLLVDAHLGTNPSNAKATVGDPKHLGLDQALDGITTIEVGVSELLALGGPETGYVLPVRVVLLGIGLQKEELKLESVGVLLLLGLLDAGIIVLGNDLTTKLLLKEGLGILECVINSKAIDVFDNLAKTSDTGVGLTALETNVQGLLKGVGLVGRDAKRCTHLGGLDHDVLRSIPNSKLDVVATVNVWLVLAESNDVSLEVGSGRNGAHLCRFLTGRPVCLVRLLRAFL